MHDEEKFIRITSDAELDYGGCYYEGDTPGIDHKLVVEEVTREDLLKKFIAQASDNELEQLGVVRKTKLDKRQKLTLEAKYALIKFEHTHAWREVKTVSPENLSEYDFHDYDLKDQYELYQKVKMSDLKKVDPKVYAAYLNEKKRVTAEKKKNAERAKKAKATKKKKELEKARKLLKEAGE